MRTKLEQLFMEHGRLWEKGNIKRMYIDAKHIIALHNEMYISKVTPSKKMLKAKVWLDLNTGIADSDVGMIRVLL